MASPFPLMIESAGAVTSVGLTRQTSDKRPSEGSNRIVSRRPAWTSGGPLRG